MIASTRLTLITTLVCLIVGCGPAKLKTEYGKTTGRSGTDSVNGFGGLRKTYAAMSWEIRSLSRLADRAKRLDSILWIPSVPTSIGTDATTWFEDWFQSGGKTLIYIACDSGNEALYWRTAMPLAPPEQRLEYRKLAAQGQVKRTNGHLSHDSPGGNGWFSLSPLDSVQPVEKVLDSDAPIPHSITNQTRLPYDADLLLHFETVEYSSNLEASKTPGWLTTTETPSTTPVDLRARKVNQSGFPLITEISSDEWGDSKVIVVAGGSLVNNYALTTVSGQDLASYLVAATGPPGQIGFLTTNYSGLSVRNRSEQDNSIASFMAVWPISIVTAHGVLLGIVVCIVLFPIFGRARNPEIPSESDFGDHLTAVAQLMARAKDERYARQRISEYMRRVRGETSGPYVLPDSAPLTTQPPKNSVPMTIDPPDSKAKS